jgi:hypothetical protein
LKGPAIARWLYADEESWRYADIDLPVDPRQFMDAERLLADLGFAESSLERAFPEERARHAHAWRRARDATTVDLHPGMYLQPTARSADAEHKLGAAFASDRNR